jgi:hypothetical protein
MRRLLFFLISFIIMAGTACKKLPTYPDIPALEYKSVTFGEGDLGKTFTLTVSFTDGDGDIGYHESGNGPTYDDTSSQYYKNFVVTMSYFINNTWRDTSLNFSTRIPYLTPDGPHKALKASIDKTDDLPFFVSPTRIRFTTFIYDRALHKSNTIVTPEFLVDNP